MSKIRIKHRLRLFKQLFTANAISIIGGYHGGNLGDIALGLAVKDNLKTICNRKGVLQTIYTINSGLWKKNNYAILGGGAIGYNGSIKKVYKKYAKELSNLAVLGVDFNDKHYDNESIELLKKARWLSCRNENQKKSLEKLTQRSDIKFHPDVAFGLSVGYCEKIRKINKKEKTVLINVVPLYSVVVNNQLQPNQQYKHERPELYENYDQMMASYVSGVRGLVQRYIDKGYKIESIPFTPQDDIVAKIILKGLEVYYYDYTDEPQKMLQQMSKAEIVFCTRYHATIFAFKLGAKIIPMAYAKKNDELLYELGFEKNQFLNSDDLAKGLKIFPNCISLDESIISEWESKSVEMMRQCFESLDLI